MLMDEPDDLEPGVAVRHVQRGHHHDADHRHVPERHGDQPEPGGGDAGRHPQPSGHRAVGRAGEVAVGDAAPTGLEEGVRAQPQQDQRDREQQADQREEERARELRDAERAGQRGAGAGEVGAETLPTVVAQTTMLRSRAR